jgi:hypothetical protein
MWFVFFSTFECILKEFSFFAIRFKSGEVCKGILYMILVSNLDDSPYQIP